MGPSLSLVLILALTPGTLSPIGAALSTSVPLDLGYRQMYNLEFEDAHRTLRSYMQTHPDDPLGPTSDAAAYLFAEFDRLGVLQTELFVDDDKFKGRKRPAPDPALKMAFDKALAVSDRLADARLRSSPNDTNALYSKVLNQGLRADYLALIEKRNLASLSYIKSAGILAQKLLAIDPNYYDAYLAIGFENYMLGLNPAPVRWLLRLYGAEADKEQGIQHLQLTAEKGHYLLPLARLLLTVAALREKDRNGARRLLENLAQEFPGNQLYRRELSRLN